MAAKTLEPTVTHLLRLAVGIRDLDHLRAVQLARAGSPALEGGWRYDAATRRIVIDLAQRQAGDAFRLSLDIGIAAADGSLRIETVELTRKEERIELAADKEPTAVTLDPNTWLLAEIRFGKR